ncbi:MAG: ATP-binding protein [Steroidobacteraceae bacterium]
MKLRVEMLHRLVELAPDAMLVIDAEGVIVYANQQALTLFACEHADFIGAAVETLMPERYRARHHQHRRRFAADGRLRPMGVGLELYGLKRDGTEFPVEISLSPLDTESTLTAAAIRDVTARKLVERELLSAREAADRANQAKSRFLSTASHDLRQPLQALSLLNGTLRRMNLPLMAAQALLQQERSIDAMKRLLNALLDISKLESGAVKPELVHFELSALCEGIAAEIEGPATEKGLQVRLELEPTYAFSDPALVEQILRNLLSNALKYTQQGSLTLRCRAHDGQPRVEVADTGVGIPTNQIPLIFEEFFQVGVTANATGSGYGLGLAIVQRLVRLLNLKLRVHSELGKGSTFELDLPPGAGHIAVTDYKTDATATLSSRSQRPGTVLLVEDDAAVLAATGLLLEMENYRVVTATNRTEALQRVREDTDIDLMVTDFHLDAGETGLEVMNAVRAELRRELPIVITSGDTSSLVKKLPHDAGLRLASKPIDAEELLRLLRELVEAAPGENRPEYQGSAAMQTHGVSQ